MSKSDAGKGDRPRPVDKKRYDENYERIFGKENWFCTKVFPVSHHCCSCRHNEKTIETHTILYCPITEVEPDKEKCTNEDDRRSDDCKEPVSKKDDVQGSEKASAS